MKLSRNKVSEGAFLSKGGQNDMKTRTFDEVLELIESFPDEQRESLLEIVRNRLIEERREQLAQTVQEARGEYARGEVRQGTVDDLMRELDR
jgi:ClpP class serine protease